MHVLVSRGDSSVWYVYIQDGGEWWGIMNDIVVAASLVLLMRADLSG